MNWLNFFDDLGIALLCRPIRYLIDLEMLNFMDDLGVKFLIRPLGKLDASWPVLPETVERWYYR